MSRLIFLVTHGKKMEGANPGLSPLGKYQTSQLRGFLPAKPKNVVCGTGTRHIDTARALGLEPTRFSIVVGAPESKVPGKNLVILADGTILPYELYTSVADRTEAFCKLVGNLPDKVVVITSRSMIGVLSDSVQPKAAAVYRYNPSTGKLEELFAASDDVGEGDQEV